MAVCARCRLRSLEVGVLCAECAGSVPLAAGLLSDHLSSTGAAAPDAWLIDGYGAAHPVSARRQRLGRQPGQELVILHHSVSRAHAELARGEGGWTVRDLGSRNGTRVDDRRVIGRAPLTTGAVVQLGEVALVFVGPDAVAAPSALAPATTGSAVAGGFRAALRGPAIELCVLGTDDLDVGGVLLHRALGAAAWAELSLPPVEYHLLRTLCEAALTAKGAPQRSRGAVVTRALAKAVPFKSRYPNDENVRQAVRRLRTTLDEIGAVGVVESVPGRGYFLGWPVSPS